MQWNLSKWQLLGWGVGVGCVGCGGVCVCVCGGGGGGGGGGSLLRVSRCMLRGFAPYFRHLGDLFAPPQIWPCLPFHSHLVGSHFESPQFSACRRSSCPPKCTKSIILSRSCWVPFWSSSGAPLLIFNRSTPHPNMTFPFRYVNSDSGARLWKG